MRLVPGKHARCLLWGTLWYVCSAAGNIYIKQTFVEEKWDIEILSALLDLLMLQLAFSALIGAAYPSPRAYRTQRTPRRHGIGATAGVVHACNSDDPGARASMVPPERAGEPFCWSQLSDVCACHVLGGLMNNISYTLMGATATVAMKSCEPMFTVALSMSILGEAYGHGTFIAVLLVASGVAVYSIATLSYSWPGILCASASNVVLPLRNVLAKRLQDRHRGARPAELFAPVSIMGTAVVGVPWAAKVAVMGVALPATGVAAAFFVAAYQVSSFAVLGTVSALTHAVANVGKRAVVATTSIVYFSDVIPVRGFVGLGMAGCGLALYSAVKIGAVKDASLNSGHSIAVASAVALVVRDALVDTRT